MLQAEIVSIAKEAQKIARVFPACYQQNFSYASIDQSLDRVLDHWFVVHRKQVLIRDFGQWIEPAARPTRKNDSLHLVLPMLDLC